MLTIENISFQYKEERKVLDSISFTLERGKHLAVMGESGCGKSSLLKLIYGLYDVNEGTIEWDHHKITGPKYNLVPGMSFIKYLAQDFDLMPYISVGENVGKYLSNIDYVKKQRRIDELLEVVEMSDLKHEKAKNLSGGQMQRVALAKALAKSPELLLLDEPFSHIDNFRKNSLRRRLFKYVKDNEITCITATHDQQDVLAFSDELLVLKQGKQIDFGTTKELYKNSKFIYTKQLFNDCNEIFHRKEENDGANYSLAYAYELEICEMSDIQVRVLRSFFNGSGYIIESINCKDQSTIYFENNSELRENEIYFIKIKPN